MVAYNVAASGYEGERKRETLEQLENEPCDKSRISSKDSRTIFQLSYEPFHANSAPKRDPSVTVVI